ncbi:unnamed protein product [Rangifer tarandus platyrhynchus]|uniref:Uncharacterized protein n=2 Tax=Rangifer tarandus platyrhynchus TaxID=3082113 RepID=A0ACB0EZH9_RANTA|nr:unnamed protein product [Rangifer tarandus platyrhynchus]CAI9705539.1 unnamed protein product [Rangifer tarandus platyrhynchus]
MRALRVNRQLQWPLVQAGTWSRKDEQLHKLPEPLEQGREHAWTQPDAAGSPQPDALWTSGPGSWYNGSCSSIQRARSSGHDLAQAGTHG